MIVSVVADEPVEKQLVQNQDFKKIVIVRCL